MEFTEKHDLPSGGWVEMRNANYLRAKDRNALVRKVNGADSDDISQIDKGINSIQAMAAMMITAWWLPYDPDPVTEEDGTQTPRKWVLPSEDQSILDEVYATDATAIERLLEPAGRVINPKAPSPDDTDDPKSPSGPLSE